MSIADFGLARLILGSETPPVVLDDSGWPERLHIGAIAALQVGAIDGEGHRVRQYEAVCSALTHAVRVAGTLPYEDVEYARTRWIEGSIDRGYRVRAAAWINAQDVALWMQSHGEEGSPLLRLWFDARGVACQPVSAVVANTDPSTLADWPALVAYRKANKGKDWGLGKQIEIVRAELKRRCDDKRVNKSDALAQMGRELGLGTTDDGARKALNKVLSVERKRNKKAAPDTTTTVFTGLGDRSNVA